MRWISLFLFSFITLIGQEIDLSESETSLYSSNGEEGVLTKIFELVGTRSKFCVDLGAGDGITGSNTYLLQLQGWDALLLDRAFEKGEIHLYKEFITAENINLLFEKYRVRSDLDFLSIDIDYNTYYLWKALKYFPAVVVVRFNAKHSPFDDKVVEYHPYYSGDGSDYFGASILAYFHLARKKGYSLIYCDQKGEKLFFVRDDLLENLSFKDVNDVAKLYRSSFKEFPHDPRNRKYLTSMDIHQ